MLTILALSLYVFVAAASLFAMLQAFKTGQPIAERMTWGISSLFFLGLAAMRALGVEEIVRMSIREYAKGNALYSDRWYLQAPLFILTFVAISALAWFLFQRMRIARVSKRAFMSNIAQLAMLSFVPLIALRMISIHNFDRLLYGGPVKLNWILEFGLCSAVLVAACIYARRCIQWTARAKAK